MNGPRRPHGKYLLAAEGIELFQYIGFEAERARSTVAELWGTAEADVYAEHCAEVKAGIENRVPNSTIVKGKPSQRQKPEEAPEAIRLESLKAAKSSTVPSVKGVVGRASKEVHQFRDGLPKLRAKGDPFIR